MRSDGKPGHMIFENNEDSAVIGFIDFVSDCEVAIMLFDQCIIKGFKFKHIAETVDWETRLNEILLADYDMAIMWQDMSLDTVIDDFD